MDNDYTCPEWCTCEGGPGIDRDEQQRRRWALRTLRDVVTAGFQANVGHPPGLMARLVRAGDLAADLSC